MLYSYKAMVLKLSWPASKYFKGINKSMSHRVGVQRQEANQKHQNGGWELMGKLGN